MKVKTGSSPIDTSDGRSQQRFSSERYLEAKNFIGELARRCGDHQPDFEEIHLPCSITKSSAYEEYSSEKTAVGQQPLSKQRFLDVWKDNFPHVKIRKVSQQYMYFAPK